MDSNVIASCSRIPGLVIVVLGGYGLNVVTSRAAIYAA
jgi:hypothetical protein